MMMNAYSIYDSKVGQYGLPFFSHHHALALRIVVEAANDENTNLSKYPNDYVLFCIGNYDDSNGVLQSNPPKISVSSEPSFMQPSPIIFGEPNTLQRRRPQFLEVINNEQAAFCDDREPQFRNRSKRRHSPVILRPFAWSQNDAE